MSWPAKIFRTLSPARDVRPAAVLVSLVLSAWCVFQDPVINEDGIGYLAAAAAFRGGDWSGGSAVYRYPLYPLLVGAWSRATGCDLELSAHMLNAIFHAGIVAAFLSLVRALGGDHRTVFFAAAAILAFPALNEYRSAVTRDGAYAAFYLLAILIFVRHLHRPTWTSGLGWGAAMLAAAFFRVEGLVLLLLLPLVLLLDRRSRPPARLASFAKAMALPGALALAAGLLFLLPGLRDSTALGTLYPREPWARVLLFRNALQTLPRKAAVLSETLFHGHLKDYSLTVLGIALAYVPLAEAVKSLTPLHAGLGGYAVAKRSAFPERSFLPAWIWLALLDLGILYVYLVPQFLITGRYLLPLALTLLLAAPFGLARLHAGWREKPAFPLRRNWLFPLAAILLAAGAVDGLISFGPSKAYLKEAGAWLRAELPAGSALFTNERVIKFYAGRVVVPEDRNLNAAETLKALAAIPKRAPGHAAIQVEAREAAQAAKLEALFRRPPVRVFANRRGDRVLIFSTGG